MEGRKEMFYLTTHSTQFTVNKYGVRYMERKRKPGDTTTWAALSD